MLRACLKFGKKRGGGVDLTRKFYGLAKKGGIFSIANLQKPNPWGWGYLKFENEF